MICTCCLFTFAENLNKYRFITFVTPSVDGLTCSKRWSLEICMDRGAYAKPGCHLCFIRITLPWSPTNSSQMSLLPFWSVSTWRAFHSTISRRISGQRKIEIRSYASYKKYLHTYRLPNCQQQYTHKKMPPEDPIAASQLHQLDSQQ